MKDRLRPEIGRCAAAPLLPSANLRLGVPQRATATRGNVRLSVGQRFNPYKLFYGIFIPEAIARYRGISLGAKMIYGRLCRYAGEDGDAHPSVDALAHEVGIGETQARQYLRELQREGLIGSEERIDETGRQTSNQYFFLWHPAFDGVIGDTRKNPRAGVRKTAPSPLRISEPGRVRKTEPEENHHQESQKKESQKKAEDFGKQTVPERPQVARKPEETPKSLSLNADDEKPMPLPEVRAAFEDPREEFRARISERHPEADAEYVLACLTCELSEKNLGLKEFLAFDSKCTTNPRHVQNPPGYYRGLARRLNGQLEAAAFEEKKRLSDQISALLAVPEPAQPKGPRCPLCRDVEGKGIVLSGDKKGFEPCSCATPEFAAEFRAKEVARRNREIEIAAHRETTATIAVSGSPFRGTSAIQQNNGNEYRPETKGGDCNAIN